ncbi:DUF6888 family protein [Iningainema tapete]|uniref:DUF6888 domain-containing protein n=1 Tax=Iningainema tapete BLCC-T55 TaxID=2748662 RepID=A0A8J6XKC5_9CYAN|nr:hypothetical protein [Iningainema tapete]MBD2778505.1 hypothetical protein [Iningainema tapete BLCC-T55]
MQQQPNHRQLREFVSMSQWLTSSSFPLHLIRMDERTRDVFILAGDILEITIREDGQVYYDQTLHSDTSKAELRDYVLKHREDNEAFYKFSDRVRATAKPIDGDEFFQILASASKYQ